MDLITLICGGVLVVAIAAALLRWFRVAQREQYVPGYTSRFDARWRWSSTTNLALYAVALLAALLSFWIIPLSLVTAAVLVVGPLGLGIRGSTAQLVWTRRMMTIAAVTIAIDVMLAIIGFSLAPIAILAFIALGQSAMVDLALLLLAPIEHRGARGWMGRAVDAMGSQRPTVVAITGSYGKTTTKEITRQLLAGTYDVVASPASFNNLGGLARTITEHVGPATEVLIAEMGTYGPGEIAELCSFLPPTVAVITAIGPVHLERMKTLERIAAAKEEILGRASIAVLNVDDPLIAPMAERFAARGRVIRVSTADRSADVYVGPTDGRLHPVIAGEAAGTVELPSLDPINVACAIGVAVALDVPVATIAKRLGSLTGAVHRREVVTSATGVSIIDDTYNSNPAGAAAALALLRSIGTPNAQRVVVTPGMVELGTIQAEENRHFAEHAAEIATTIIVVGSTNRRALTEGAAGRAATVMTVARRDDATAWVGEHLAAGDAVLYENDLPDHYP